MKNAITINKTPSFTEIWHEGHIEHEGKYHYFWLIHPQGVDPNGEAYSCEVRWFFQKVPKQVRDLYPIIIESFMQTLR
jgi:hypothetical protein